MFPSVSMPVQGKSKSRFSITLYSHPFLPQLNKVKTCFLYFLACVSMRTREIKEQVFVYFVLSPIFASTE